MEELHIVQATSDHAIGYVREAVLYVWRGTTTVAGARALEQTLKMVSSRAQGAASVLLGVVEAGAPPPESDVRKALANALGAGAGFVCASAVVFEGQGFRASMVRAVATGLAMLARHPFPHESFASVSAATRWLEQRRDTTGMAICSIPALDGHLHALRTAPHR